MRRWSKCSRDLWVVLDGKTSVQICSFVPGRSLCDSCEVKIGLLAHGRWFPRGQPLVQIQTGRLVSHPRREGEINRDRTSIFHSTRLLGRAQPCRLYLIRDWPEQWVRGDEVPFSPF